MRFDRLDSFHAISPEGDVILVELFAKPDNNIMIVFGETELSLDGDSALHLAESLLSTYYEGCDQSEL